MAAYELRTAEGATLGSVVTSSQAKPEAWHNLTQGLCHLRVGTRHHLQVGLDPLLETDVFLVWLDTDGREMHRQAVERRGRRPEGWGTVAVMPEDDPGASE